MQEFVNSLHFGTRFLLIFMVVIYLIQFLLLDSRIQGYLTFCPSLIVEKGQVWRLITGAFLHGGILHLCMNMLSFTQLGLTFESHVGTLSYFYHIIIFGLISSCFHTLIAFIMYLGGDSSQWSSSAVGFSGILFALIVVDITISGGDERSILGLFLVPSWLYPWVMLLLICSLLIQNVSFLGHLSGIIAGYLYQFNILRFVTPPIRFFSAIEHKCCCCCLNRLGYISAEGVGGGRPWAVFQHAFQDDNNDNDTQINHFNGQGRTLGVTPDNTNIRENTNEINNNPFANQQGRTVGHQNEDNENAPLDNLEIHLSDIDKDEEKPNP